MTDINYRDMTNNNFEDSPSQSYIDDIKKKCQKLDIEHNIFLISMKLNFQKQKVMMRVELRWN